MNLKESIVKQLNKKANKEIVKKADNLDTIETPIETLTIFNRQFLLDTLNKAIGVIPFNDGLQDVSFIIDSNQSYLNWTLEISKSGLGFMIKPIIKDIKVIGSIEVSTEFDTLTEDNIEIPLDLSKINIESNISDDFVYLNYIDILKDGTINIVFK